MEQGSKSFDKAADRERDNPKCGECGVFPTNHFCSFVSADGEKCLKPVCAICRGERDVTRCSAHLWSDGMQSNVSLPSTVAEKELVAPNAKKKARRIVAKNTLQLCSECKKHSTPSVCVVCQVPVCTHCKLHSNGSLGPYCCSVHAKKVQISVVVNRPDELQRYQAEKPSDVTTGPIAEGVSATGTTSSARESGALGTGTSDKDSCTAAMGKASATVATEKADKRKGKLSSNTNTTGNSLQ